MFLSFEEVQDLIEKLNKTDLWIPGDWGNLLVFLLTVWKKVELWENFMD
jgi:hypothetical protein